MFEMGFVQCSEINICVANNLCSCTHWPYNQSHSPTQYIFFLHSFTIFFSYTITFDNTQYQWKIIIAENKLKKIYMRKCDFLYVKINENHQIKVALERRARLYQCWPEIMIKSSFDDEWQQLNE